MDAIIRNYLKGQEIGCLAVPVESGLHGATIHYTLTDQGTFYIQTNADSRKCSLLKERGELPATLVVGFTEEDWKTYQADGRVRFLTDPAERRLFGEVRQKQYPGTNYANDPEVAFLEFIPSWYRFTDAETKPKTVLEST